MSQASKTTWPRWQAPKGGKKKSIRCYFWAKNSHLLSMAKDTNKNPVSSSAGTFSWRVGFHLDDTLTPICLPYFPGAAKCWGGVSVFIFEFPTPWISQLEWEQKELDGGGGEVVQAGMCLSTNWSHKFPWAICYHVCLSSWMFSAHQQVKPSEFCSKLKQGWKTYFLSPTSWIPFPGNSTELLRYKISNPLLSCTSFLFHFSLINLMQERIHRLLNRLSYLFPCCSTYTV